MRAKQILLLRNGALGALSVRSFLGLALFLTSVPASTFGETGRLEILPVRPFGVDLAFRQSFTPNGRELGLQASLTALHYSDFEVRATYQYFGFASHERHADVHSLYLNPRWNNFLDILDFPSGRPINRLLRHVLFGPLEDRAIPYIGAVVGSALTGPDDRAPSYLLGGQAGVRFPVAHSVSLDLALWYFAYGVSFDEHGERERQLLFTTGFVF
jgi:hypothetical protein